MRRLIRTVFVCMLIALIMYQPAAACHSCGARSRGYAYGPVYYGSGPYNGCCGGGYWMAENGCDGCGACDQCSPCSSCDEHPYDTTGGTSESNEMKAPTTPAEVPPPAMREAAPSQGAVNARPEAATAPELPPSTPAST